MSEFEVDPAALRMAVRDVDEIARHAESLARRAQDMAHARTRQHFPRLPEAQQAAARWDEARAAFADGLSRVADALHGLSRKLAKAGDDYEQTDAGASTRIENIP